VPRPMPSLLEITALRKWYGSSEVLRGVDLTVRSGQIHALIGPNGAGKSTIIKILSGVEKADSGAIRLSGSTDSTAARSVGVIHQDLALVDRLTIRENLLLTRPKVRFKWLVDRKKEREEAIASLELVAMNIDPETFVGDLSLGQKSLVAVARLLSADSHVLVLDEVTAALSKAESEWVFTELRRIAGNGAGIIVVSHRLQEIADHCDYVTFVSDGKVGYSGQMPNVSTLHELFVGGERSYSDPVTRQTQVPELAPVPRQAVASLRGARTARVGPIDLDVHAGEVVALVGNLSSRLYEIGHLMAGRARLSEGDRSVVSREGSGPGAVAFLPEDRKLLAMLTLLDVTSNATIAALDKFSRFGWLSLNAERNAVAEIIRELNVQPAHSATLIDHLSGGNAQKIMMGRCALAAPDLYVLCEPTRGVDVGTRHAIYRFIDRIRAANAAVLVLTIDADDALAVADRIGIVEDGRIVFVGPASKLTVTEVLERT
jgi:ribose transport system ATP-binding protein